MMSIVLLWWWITSLSSVIWACCDRTRVASSDRRSSVAEHRRCSNPTVIWYEHHAPTTMRPSTTKSSHDMRDQGTKANVQATSKVVAKNQSVVRGSSLGVAGVGGGDYSGQPCGIHPASSSAVITVSLIYACPGLDRFRLDRASSFVSVRPDCL